jgi:hypothetical protein
MGELGVGAHVDDSVVAWAFGLSLRRLCVQKVDEASALEAPARAAAGVLGGPRQVAVVERTYGDEQAFHRDH